MRIINLAVLNYQVIVNSQIIHHSLLAVRTKFSIMVNEHSNSLAWVQSIVGRTEGPDRCRWRRFPDGGWKAWLKSTAASPGLGRVPISVGAEGPLAPHPWPQVWRGKLEPRGAGRNVPAVRQRPEGQGSCCHSAHPFPNFHLSHCSSPGVDRVARAQTVPPGFPQEWGKVSL